MSNLRASASISCHWWSKRRKCAYSIYDGSCVLPQSAECSKRFSEFRHQPERRTRDDAQHAVTNCARNDAAIAAAGSHLCVTPFLRITVVLHFLRQALGTQTAPSNQVLTGLALFLSMLIVQPVFSDIYTQAWQPLEKGEISGEQAFDRGSAPLRKFLLRFARERDIQLFVEVATNQRRAVPPISA